MNKEEILKEIEKTKKHLSNMQNMLEECGSERWKPKSNEKYYYVNQLIAASRAVNDEFDIDAARYRTYNCFRTAEEAKREAEKILVRRQLEDIARRLNKDVKIDWRNDNQDKYCLVYDAGYHHINQDSSVNVIRQGTVYCLDRNFKDVAIKEIGEERLIKYLKGEINEES